MDGGFPAHAFVTEGGEKLDPFDVLAVIETATNGSAAPGIQQSAAGILRGVLISWQAVRELSEITQTVRPRRMLRSVNKLLAAITGLNLAPPPCPGADEEADKRLARQSATRQMNQYRATLASLRTEPKLERFWGPYAPALDDWAARWTKTREAIGADLDQCGGDDLYRDFDALTAEWNTFITSGRFSASKLGTESPNASDGDEAVRSPELNVPLVEHNRSDDLQEEVNSPSATPAQAPQMAAAVGGIAFAIDQEESTVTFEAGISIKGAPARLMACLLPPHLKGSRAATPGDYAFQYTKAKVLAKQLNLTEASLRQIIQRCRKSLSDQFHQRCGIDLGRGDVIENQKWLGYRINPQLVLRPELLRDDRTSQPA
jgi:hypothetical protein